jgi:CRISPR-associated protein Cas7/Cst2/DevR subtype I-B
MPKRAFISLVVKISGNVNADIGIGTRIPLKKIYTWNQEVKAFVSARCVRRCLRERLYEKDPKNLNIDPLMLIGQPPRQQLADIADPVAYADDDLFGFLSPEAPPRRRYAPVKISHLVSLKHTEIKPEFAGRFQRDFLPQYQLAYPVPFEIEVAEWLGRLDVIISERIGCFDPDEITKEQRRGLRERDGKFYLNVDVRKTRLKALLEILLWEGWQFPRAAQSPSVPDYHYAVIATSDRFMPIFGYVDVVESGKLSEGLLNQLKTVYWELTDKLFVLNYKDGRVTIFKKVEGSSSIESKEHELNSEKMKEILNQIINYVIRE